MNKQNRINQLINTKRLEFKSKQSNTTRGLYDLINKYITNESVVVELGSFSGVSSELFALHCKTLYCIDPWLPYWEINDSEKMNYAEAKFDCMMKQYNNIVKYKLKSTESISKFENNSVDLIYIDSDHSAENVQKEIVSWLPKIKNNGYVAGHDINLPTVFNVVTKYFDPTYLELFNDTSWIVNINKLITPLV